MGADRRRDLLTLPSPLGELQERGPVLLVFLRHFG
jgi:hypothetical protein